MDFTIILFAPIAGIIALVFAAILAVYIKKSDPGNKRMVEIMGYIHEGAMAFLSREYKVLSIFVVVLSVIIGIFLKSWLTAGSFVLGALFSVMAGYFGMNVATMANARTANAAQTGQNKALGIAFKGGTVMGMCVVGLGLLGIGTLYLLIQDIKVITGFGLGASSIALFARVGGGIYTKAADVGADLVGKIEAGIPEDDPRNPAVIADNVGDNVGDVAGMGADLFESYVGAIISAITLGTFAFAGRTEGIIFPLLLSSIGIIASIQGSLFVRTGEKSNPQSALSKGTYISALLVLAGSFFLSRMMFGNLGAFYSVAVGLIAGVIIGYVTEIYTSGEYNSVKKISKQSETGAATTIISGLGVGMASTVAPVLFICVAVLVAYYNLGLYGIALAAVGMLSTTGMTVAVDAYGPIADNAGGIAQMADLPKSVREITDKLDSIGNTTAAIGKGFAIGSAALTALALFASYSTAVGLESIDILEPKVMIGLFIGGMLPFLFSALTMEAVSKAANQMIEEVRRQFKTIPGIMEGTAKPEYAKCVDISTAAALKEMIVPGLLAVIVPIAVGIYDKGALGGLIAGAVVTGVLLATMMANAGGAWDNAKKFVESGEHGGKGSAAHTATVVGDTVGDPFKDTAGPSMNILIKLMTIVALVFAPLFL
ncbi:MAG: sodium-translocating pyrophosphatase [Clostridiales bacterium GWB2_37_7]|nr:MAG: sodium-translocating pyrophosphatase [Clostridiales bacterium GWB2_37_7]